MLPADKIRELEAFLQKRRKKSGGFGATPKLPVTVQDTYHALSIIYTLDRKKEMGLAEDIALHDYLAEAAEVERHGAKITYQAMACSRMLDLPLNHKMAASFINRRLAETTDLEELYYCCRITRDILGDRGERFMALVGPASAWRFRAASELMMLLYLSSASDGAGRKFIDWLRECQSFDGGFGFLPGTTSFVENCFDCLAGLTLLHGFPKDPQGCRSYILACWTKSGGFARKNGATAFLSSTWHAVGALSLLTPLLLNS